MTPQRIQEQLQQFIALVKNSQTSERTEHDMFAEEYPDLFEAYRALYEQTQSFDFQAALSSFSTQEQKAIEFLHLGIQDKKQFDIVLQELAASHLTQENIDTTQPSSQWEGAKAMAEFIKTRQGFELVHGSPQFEKYNDEELAVIFGSIFGMKLAADCVKSLKAEKVGSVIGYALSGLYVEDLAVYATKTPAEQKALPLGDYLRQRIKEQDVEGRFAFKEDPSNRTATLSCFIDTTKGAPDTNNRAGNCADHTFVNHSTKTITFGQSTSHDNTEKQGISFYKALKGFQLMTEQPTIHGEPNPYFGYKIQPYYFMAGIFLASDEDQLDLFQSQEIGGQFLSQLGTLHLGEKEKLAQLQFYRLFGNTENIKSANSLAQFNPFIGGVDTQELYNWHHKTVEQQHTKPEELNLALFQNTIGYMTDITRIVARSNMDLSLPGKTILSTYLDAIVDMSEQMFVGFNHQATPTEYQTYIAPFHAALVDLINKGSDKPTMAGGNVLRALKRNAKLYQSLASFNEQSQEIKTTLYGNEISWVAPEKKMSAPILKPYDFSTLQKFYIPDLITSIAAQTEGVKTKKSAALAGRYAQIMKNIIVNQETPLGAKTIAYGLDMGHKYTQQVNYMTRPGAFSDNEALNELVARTAFIGLACPQTEPARTQHYEARIQKLQELFDDNPELLALGEAAYLNRLHQEKSPPPTAATTRRTGKKK